MKTDTQCSSNLLSTAGSAQRADDVGVGISAPNVKWRYKNIYLSSLSFLPNILSNISRACQWNRITESLQSQNKSADFDTPKLPRNNGSIKSSHWAGLKHSPRCLSRASLKHPSRSLSPLARKDMLSNTRGSKPRRTCM